MARFDALLLLVLDIKYTYYLRRCTPPTASYTPMQGETRERWQKLCEQAANEQDPQKLMALIREINTLLEEKENRLQYRKQAASAETTR